MSHPGRGRRLSLRGPLDLGVLGITATHCSLLLDGDVTDLSSTNSGALVVTQSLGEVVRVLKNERPDQASLGQHQTPATIE